MVEAESGASTGANIARGIKYEMLLIPQLRMVNPYGTYVTQGPAAGALIHQP